MASSFSKETHLILFYKIINGLTAVPFEGILIEAYKDTRKQNKKFGPAFQVLNV